MKSFGVCYWYIEMPWCGVCGAWIKIYYVLCSKTYSTFGGLFWFPGGSQRVARGTGICETRLFNTAHKGLFIALDIFSLNITKVQWLKSPNIDVLSRFKMQLSHQAKGYDIALTHWGRVTHICVGKLTIIGSDNGLSPGRRQAIIWTNAGILLIRPLGIKLQWNFNRNSNIFIQENALENVVCQMASICLGLNVLTLSVLHECQIVSFY